MIIFAMLLSSELMGAPMNQPIVEFEHSEVCFMYGASAEVYQQYGCTVLAWGPTPTEASRAATREAGVMAFGSVGMVTEFGRFIDRFPERYREAICVDVHGEPIRVPWLWDHTHKGVPAYWMCTNQPVFREYLRERVADTAARGADGIHVDDHLGTSGNLWHGGCYCDQCMSGFAEFLGDDVAGDFDFGAHVRTWLEDNPDKAEQRWTWPYYHEFQVFQYRAAAELMAELKGLAAETAGRPLPMGANAGVPSVAHLSDYPSLDLLSCEVAQHADQRRPSSGVAFAYRMAEALDRPVAATAAGYDWALVAEEERAGLARTWIAQAYALGHFFCAPHHQWCYNEEKGTHWYEGPAEEYAWLYRFVADHAAQLDGFETLADVGIVVAAAAQRQGKRDADQLAAGLAEAGIPFRVLLGGDDALPCRITAEELAECPLIISPNTEQLQPEDRALLAQRAEDNGVLPWSDVDAVVAQLAAPVAIEGAARAWALPRRNPETGAVAIHIANLDYDPEEDDVRPVSAAVLRVDASLVPGGATQAAVHRASPQPLEPVVVNLDRAGDEVVVELPELGLWAIVEVG
ncbi:MAG: hypothetical protein GF320_09300 [Armatimonadia bacterium]|nr:hypothetical protein [Armatimonadia bacterium]